MAAEDRPESYRIGDLTLDLVRRNVRRQRESLPCGKLTFDLLALLAERAPAVVSREEVVERLWEGRYVSPATVKQRVSLLRQALGDRADEPRYIRVVRGQGYTLIPNARAVYSKPTHAAGWKRLGLAASVVLTVFLVGAEIGYRDGLKPRIPDLDQSVSILVTSWPLSSRDAAEFDRDLPQQDYLFVMGVAKRILTILEDADFVGKLDAAYALGGNVRAQGSLTIVANASIRDHETIGVRLTVLNKSLSDNRLARIHAIESWSRAARRTPAGERESSTVARFQVADIGPALTRDNDIRIFPPGRAEGQSFMLVANLDFNRGEIQARPDAVQADAARSIAMAIDEQIPGMELFGAR